MDPWLEGGEWESFHAALMVDLADALCPQVAPKYVVRPQRRVYVEYPTHETRMIVSDGLVLGSPDAAFDSAPAVAVADPPDTTVEVVLQMPEEHREIYLTVREVPTMEIVTVIELLSPGNKRFGEGRREYLQKRQELLDSGTSFVEIDLLRSGHRLPTATPLPPGDYCALICRSWRKPRAEALGWTLRQRLPKIPIPLRRGEPDASLDLQAAFTSRYDRGYYATSLNYNRPVDPPLSPSDAAWAEGLLNSRPNGTA